MTELDRKEKKQLHFALTKALPTKGDWERMMSFELNESLGRISSLGPIDNIAFEVINWAISRGRLDDLVNGACEYNNTNPELLQFRRDVWQPRVMANAQLRGGSQVLYANTFVLEGGAKPADIKTEQVTNDSEKSVPAQKSATMYLPHNGPIELYYSYADEDAGFITLLQRHLVMLNRSGLVVTWHRGMLHIGENEYNERLRYLNQAHIILLCISPRFIEAEHTYDEAVRAVQRSQTEGIVVVPLIWRPTTDWKHAPFGGLQAFPKTEKALAEYSGAERDKVLKEIAIAIRQTVENLGQQ